MEARSKTRSSAESDVASSMSQPYNFEMRLRRGTFTNLDYIIVGIYPLTLILGFCFSFGHSTSYFAHSHNIFNIVFVKNGWLWTSIVFFMHMYRLPVNATKKHQALVRWTLATLLWILVTQWAFGAPLTDRTMLWTGGICELAEAGAKSDVSIGETSEKIIAYTNQACKKAHGHWRGGHDLSGHVFILSHSSLFIWYEILPILIQQNELLGQGPTQAAYALISGWWWMLLMTAAYFHTWKEKLTGLFTGLLGWLLIYKIAPRYSALVSLIGSPTTV